MVLFSKGKVGGFMDEIRCDEPSYLVWKWHPSGLELNHNNRENAVRWGSPLRVKEGEVAVFVYKKDDGDSMDFIEGPFDDILKTKNLPVIASIVGLAYEGGTPFQAEVYFINVARIVQMKFGVPYFNVFDSRYPDFGVPVAVRGMITFSIADYKEFIKFNRLQNFTIEDLQKQVRAMINQSVKNIVIGLPVKNNISLYQIEGCIDEVQDRLLEDVQPRMKDEFGINVSSIDVSNIEIDKTSVDYVRFKSMTADITEATVKTQTEANLTRIRETNRIEIENMEDTLRRQREEDQYARHMNTQTTNFQTFQVEAQTKVGVAGAEALGKMGENGAGGINVGGSDSTGFNPAAMMAGMALGSAVGQNIAGTMNGMLNGVSQNIPPIQRVTPPPIPTEKYYVAVNGQATGPYDVANIKLMIANNQINSDTLLWKEGMGNWIKVSEVSGFSNNFR